MACAVGIVTPPAPASGPTSGGTVVTLDVYCAGFGWTVYFDVTPVVPSLVTPLGGDVWQLQVTTPPHAAGVVDVTADNGSGSDTAFGAFTYIGAPPPPPPPAPDVKNDAGDDTFVDPVTIPGGYSRIVLKTLSESEAPESRYEEIRQEFLAAWPLFAEREITVTWVKTFRYDNGSGIYRCAYRLVALESPQVVSVEFVLSASSVPEDTPAASIGVVMTTGDSNPLKQTCAVKIKDLLTGTASSGTDYAVFPDLELVFPGGSPSGTVINFTVGPIDDVDPEPDETVDLELFSPVNCSLGGQTAHELTINDNDAVATITVRFVTAADFVSDTLPFDHTFYVVVETSDLAPTGAPCSADVVDLLTGTATPGVDYDPFGTAPLIIPASTPHGTTFPVTIYNCNPPSPAETINLALQNNVGCLIGVPGTYTLTYEFASS